MSKTLLNRLAMFEVLDTAGPLTISELAQRSGLDVTVVSRTVAACEPDGWLMRLGSKVMLGPRSTLLGHAGPVADVIAHAVPLVHAIAGVTGMLTHAYGLVGRSAALIATAAGRESTVPAGLAVQAPLYATAGGRAIAAQLDPIRLDRLLPPDPFPDAVAVVTAMMGTSAEALFTGADEARQSDPPLARTRSELHAQLEAIQHERIVVDQGALDPTIVCLATPWPQPALPAALACLGTRDAMAANDVVIRRALTAAAVPGATPHDIIAAAADAIAIGG